ncbi:MULTISPECIES: response regulator [Thiomicrorhabdus]|uniref:Two-component system response regulator n=1 Tax=Thiomicrorhabdus heinhorstiae TaxID=2748010 RepID=A0ABS0BUM0_9GAMM|nr:MULTISPECIES: two-component system response regulator [Thiomicrorhabdus]MBF6057537.1 two-component system response regulator [Thiomicrorhabdus heinhorstiae]
MDSQIHPKLLCVDDTAANLKLLIELLSPLYEIKIATNGLKALEILQTYPADLILLDIMMPEMDGYEVCRRIRSNPETKDTPILFLTAKNQPEDEEKGLKLGANDFVSKPLNPRVLLARIETQIKLHFAQQKLQQHNQNLEEQVEKRLNEIQRLQDSTIFVMTSLAEFRDECTGNHIQRTQDYVQLLAKAAAQTPQFRSQLSPSKIEIITQSAPLHDIGKINIPDNILLKPGKLTSEEFEIMKTHSQKGYEILHQASLNMGESGDFLEIAQQIALSHHEKWDGSGYPQGLKGEQIPLPARLMALADVYDALTSERPYKKAFSSDKALEIIQEGRGSHFQEILVDLFISLKDDLEKIAAKNPDR